ncbi:MAG: 50S ribosomal protein L9 [Acidimicrobiia bacterium]
MSTKVILTQDVSDLGTKGEIVEVKDGYARNYLVPRSLAVKATRGAVKQAETMRQAREEAVKRELAEAEALAQQLIGARVVVAARSGDEGKLFGSIGASDIAEAIKKFTGVEVDAKIINIEQPIKEIGLHEIDLQPHERVDFTVTLDVIPA